MAEENKSKGLLGGTLELGGKVISAPFKFVGGAVGGFVKLSGNLADKAGRGLLGDGIMDKAEAPFKLLGTFGKGAVDKVKNRLKTISAEFQLSVLKNKLMAMAVEFINSLKSTLDKNNKSVAQAKETAAKKGYSTEQTMAKIDEKTKDTKIFKENKGQNKTAGNMAKSNDVGKLLESATPGANGMALAGKDGLSKPDIGLNK